MLIALTLFQVKHFVADFVVQTEYQWRNKGTYGHPGGFVHAGIHAAGSLLAVWALGAPLGALILVVIADFTIHYHLDWCKERFNRQFKLSHVDALYWVSFGADQLLHQMTYLAFIWMIVR
nr:MAG: DUF3307 domain-containing protein [Hyphomicrobiales bacterium]